MLRWCRRQKRLAIAGDGDRGDFCGVRRAAGPPSLISQLLGGCTRIAVNIECRRRAAGVVRRCCDGCGRLSGPGWGFHQTAMARMAKRPRHLATPLGNVNRNHKPSQSPHLGLSIPLASPHMHNAAIDSVHLVILMFFSTRISSRLFISMLLTYTQTATTLVPAWVFVFPGQTTMLKHESN